MKPGREGSRRERVTKMARCTRRLGGRAQGGTRLRAERAQRMRKRATAGLLQGGSFRRRSNIALSGSVGKALP